jgi:hypothetical protein
VKSSEDCAGRSDRERRNKRGHDLLATMCGSFRMFGFLATTTNYCTHSEWMQQFRFGGLNWKIGVCTMCTPCPSDWAVQRSDRGGLGMFSGEWRNIRGGNAVRVPRRARFPSSGALFGRLSVGRYSFGLPRRGVLPVLGTLLTLLGIRLCWLLVFHGGRQSGPTRLRTDRPADAVR